MTANYKVLDPQLLQAETSYLRPSYKLPGEVSLSDPAIDVMSDLTKTVAQTINPCAGLQAAIERMIASNVRLLFVTNQYHHIMGIITSKDVQGERVMTFLHETGGTRDDIMVRDLMTPQIKIEVLSMEDVTKSKVGDVVQTLKRMGRQHALVVDMKDDHHVICGVLSTSQIAKAAGVDISTSDVAGANLANLAAARG